VPREASGAIGRAARVGGESRRRDRGTRVDEGGERTGGRAARVAQGQSCPKPSSSAWTSSFAANPLGSRTSSICDTEGVCG